MLSIDKNADPRLILEPWERDFLSGTVSHLIPELSQMIGTTSQAVPLQAEPLTDVLYDSFSMAGK
ncbi:MAG: hypothetical protein K0S07_66 [Chlamydiales bacterium]|nr:hypothetical protein [Chlamydiales bacterium]